MRKWIQFFCWAALIVWCGIAQANKELPLTQEEMFVKRNFVADGEVVSPPVLKEKETSGTEKWYLATFHVETCLKGHCQAGDSVTIRFFRNDDPSYEGDMSPMLKVGDKFRLFAHEAPVDAGGERIVSIYTEVSVQSQAYRTGIPGIYSPSEKTASVGSSKTGHAADQPGVPVTAANPRQPPAAVPTASRAAPAFWMSPWFGIAVSAAVAVLVCLFWAGRKKR